MARIESRLLEVSSTHGEVLSRHASHTIAAGGKRLRPLLVCIAAGVPVVGREGRMDITGMSQKDQTGVLNVSLAGEVRDVWPC